MTQPFGEPGRQRHRPPFDPVGPGRLQPVQRRGQRGDACGVGRAGPSAGGERRSTCLARPDGSRSGQGHGLVSREDDEVDVQRGQVHRQMADALGGVQADHGIRSDRPADAVDVHVAAVDVVDVGDGDPSGARSGDVRQRGVVVVARGPLVRHGKDRDVDALTAQLLLGLQPGRDVGLVVGDGDDDLVPVGEERGQPVPCDGAQSLGGAAGEVHGGPLGNRVAQEPLDPVAGLLDQGRGPVGPGVGASPGIGVGRGEVGLDGVEHGPWLLGGGRAVQVGQVRVPGDDRELGAQFLVPRRQLIGRGRTVGYGHGAQSRTRGAPASRQAMMPPVRLRTSGCPIRVSSAA